MTVRVQEADFDVGAELAALRAGDARIGALASFIGLVRDISHGTGVAEMSLEHYPGMTEKALEAIVAEAKANERIAELQALRGEINTLLGTMSEREQAEVDRLVAVYQAMRPRDAAPVFETLDDEVRLPVAAAMRPRSLAAVMAQMEPAAARELTEKLARRFEAQQLAARAAAAANAPAAATPAAVSATPAAAR